MSFIVIASWFDKGREVYIKTGLINAKLFQVVSKHVTIGTMMI